MKYAKFFSWRTAVLNSDLPPTTRHVLLTLACHMNDAGESCHPSIAKLCHETGLSNRAVISHLTIAKDRGWISIGKHGFSGQRWSNNDYRISWPDDEGSERRSLPLDLKVVNVATEGSERSDVKVVNDVHTSTPVNSPGVLQTRARAKQHTKPVPEVAPPPPGLDETAWHRWLEYRRQIRKPLKPASIPAAQRKLAAFGKDQAAVVEEAIANGWQGLFALKTNRGGYAAREHVDNSAVGKVRRANEERERRAADAQRQAGGPGVATHGGNVRPPLDQ